jgi:hypothetical protein
MINRIKPHLPFYVVSIFLTGILALCYLLNRSSGANWAWIGLPLDDNWIHLVYARSLAEHGGFFYNPGVAEAGMSSPLWVIVLAIVYKIFTPLGVTPQWIAKGSSLFFAMAVPIAAYHVALQIGLQRRWAWIVGILIAVEPNLTYGSVSGMEVPLTAFLVLLALWAGLRQSYAFCGVLLGLLVISRGEGAPIAFLIGILPLAHIYIKRKVAALITQEELLLVVKLFLPSLILGGAWALYNYSISGHFLPNTYFVKHNFALGYINLENLKNVWVGYGQFLAWSQRGMVFFTLIALAAAAVRFYKRKQIDPLILLFAIPLVHLYLFSINIKVGSESILWAFFTRRYIDFLLPILIILFITGVGFLWEQVRHIQFRPVVLVVPLFFLAVAGLLGYNLFQGNARFAESYSWDTENIETVDVAMGRWVHDNLPVHVTIAATDAGAVRFLSRPDQTIVDFMGLNCHACIGRPSDDLMNEFQPDYMVFFRQGLSDRFQYEEILSLSPERVTILGGRELVLIKVLSLPPWPPKE